MTTKPSPELLQNLLERGNRNLKRVLPQDNVQTTGTQPEPSSAGNDIPDKHADESLDEIVPTLPALSALPALPASHGHPDQSIAGTWAEPDWTILDDRRGELPEFPTDTFPAPWQDCLRRAARGAGATEGHVAVPLLAIASSLIGTARRVQASSSWSVPCTMWTAVVGFSGTAKTPGLDVTKRALAQIEKDRKHKIADLQRQHESQIEIAKAEHKKWKEAVALAIKDELQPPSMPTAAKGPGPFVAPRLYLSSVTIERIAMLVGGKAERVVGDR